MVLYILHLIVLAMILLTTEPRWSLPNALNKIEPDNAPNIYYGLIVFTVGFIPFVGLAITYFVNNKKE